MGPRYISGIYKTSNQNYTVTRNFFKKHFQPLRAKNLTQKCLSYLGPIIWNGLPDDIKLSSNVNTSKYQVKRAS